MRVLIVTHSFVTRDPRIQRQIAAFVGRGWDVDVLALDPPGERFGATFTQVRMERRRGSPLRYVWEYGVFFLRTAWWITGRMLRRRRADLVYINSLPDFLVFAALPARLRGVPIILDVHDPMPELFAAKAGTASVVRRTLELQERASVSFADRPITVHEPLADLLRTRVPDADFGIVMNVPMVERWSPIERDRASRTMVFNGSIAVRYGLDDVIAAMAEVAEEIPSIRFRLIGEGEDESHLAGLADQLGVGDRLEFVGRVPWEEMPKQFEDVWVGVNVPKPDDLGKLSFSNKIVEWVALGLPVIAEKTVPLSQHFPDDTLIYATGGEPASIADALRALHGTPDDEVDARIERSRTALDRIAWPVQEQRLLAVADELVADRD